MKSRTKDTKQPELIPVRSEEQVKQTVGTKNDFRIVVTMNTRHAWSIKDRESTQNAMNFPTYH